MRHTVYWMVIITLLAAMACGREYHPKPKGYNRFVLPERAYVTTPDTLPYRFEYSAHAVLLPDTSRIRDKHWVEVSYPMWSATVHITYKRLNGGMSLLKEYFQDAYTLTAKHQIKAHAIDESILKTPKGKTALIAEIEGETPSQLQFTVTDSLHNFLRGALYFKLKVQNDSLQPAIGYVKKDIIHLINTLDWTKNR